VVMALKKTLAFLACIFAFVLAISIVPFTLGSNAPFDIMIRLLALNGFFALSVAAMLTPFLKEVTLFFKKSFTTIHHYFAAAGLVLISLHPISVAIQAFDPTILLPNFASLYSFFFYGGSIALISIYVAFGSVLLRKKAPNYWRPFHALMYVALFFGVIHANLWGMDFQNIYVTAIYDGLFVGVLFTFGFKRWQFYQINKLRNKNHAIAQSKA
jgi:sulfoxide reductase heme-binding subunit YedZ